MKIAVSDIEANNWIEFLMIGFYDGKNYKLFNNLDNYLNFVITKKNSGLRIYFHNGGRYDFLFLLEKLILRKGKLSFINRPSGMIMINYCEKGKNISFADSYALLPASLEKLIESFDIKEKKIPIDFSKHHIFSDKKLQEHLKNDCISLFNILQIIIKKEGRIYLTVASQAMNTFMRYYFKGILLNLSDNFDNYFRKNFYKGGRVEVYKGFGKNLYYYDFNSLYPSVMLKDMPIGAMTKTNKFIIDKIGFYKVRILQDTDYLISLFSEKNSNGNYFVNADKGDIFYLCSDEIEFLIKEKIKFSIISGFYFEEKEKIFENYVNDFYKEKQEAKDSVTRYLAKLKLNSLYGKFGQQIHGKKLEIYNGQDNAVIIDSFYDLCLVDTELKVKVRGVYIAAYITALARLKHYEKMKEIGFNNIWYCDTDSIITNKKIKTSDKIGELKLEDKIKEGVFLLPKTYGYVNDKGKKVVHYKGFRSNEFSYSQLKKLLTGELKELRQKSTRILGFKESIRRKNNIKLDKGQYLKLCEQEKILKSSYTRRIIEPSKAYFFSTYPYKKNELEA